MNAEATALRTVVEVPEWTKPMHRDQRFVLLGSCFAQYMGERFRGENLSVVCNPLGAAYNPESIAVQVRQSLSLSLSSEEGDNDSLPIFLWQPTSRKGDAGEAAWRCWWANTLFSDTDERRFRETIHATFSLLGNAIREADWMFLTLGTTVCYRLKESGLIVANCHKVPDRCFEEVWLDTEECTDVLSGMMEQLSEECPKLHVVFTVSPYRYRKYGLHGSQLAKATLLLAVDNVCRRFPEKATYFPAYEILLDELRDYRFYAEDMIHPASAAADYIWEKLKKNMK